MSATPRLWSEREDTLKLCRDVTSALCTNLNTRDKLLVKEFFTQLAGTPNGIEVLRIGSTQDNEELSMVTFEAKFGFFVPADHMNSLFALEDKQANSIFSKDKG